MNLFGLFLNFKWIKSNNKILNLFIFDGQMIPREMCWTAVMVFDAMLLQIGKGAVAD